MKAFVALSRLLQGLSFACATSVALSACHQRHEPLEREPERASLVAQQPNAPPAERQRQFSDALKRYPAPSPERTAFVQKHIAEARSSNTAAMHAWASDDSTLANNAYGFLQDTADLALIPASEQPLPKAPKAAAQALWLLGDAETELRRKVLLHLNTLLTDTRELPVEPGQGEPHRVCDEAYVALRRLVAFPEPEFKKAFAIKSFYASSPPARSALIEHLSQVPTWQRILDPNKDSAAPPSKSSAPPKPRARPRATPMQ